MDDLAIIIVSTNEAHWLRPCLSSIRDHAGDIALDVVVADNESTDGTRALVEDEFPSFRVVASTAGDGDSRSGRTSFSDRPGKP